MADFEYLDEDAIQDDDPWSAGMLRKLRTSIEHVREERYSRVSYPWLSRPRLWAIHRGAYAIGAMWLPNGGEALTVRLEVEDVTCGSEPQSYIAQHLHVTTGVGARIGLPPLDVGQWEKIAEVGVDDESVFVFDEIVNQQSARGWVVFYLWVLSRTASSAEDSGTSSVTHPNGGVELTSITNEPASPFAERALELYTDPGAKGLGAAGGQVAPPMAIGFWETGPADTAWIQPNHTDRLIDGQTKSWATYECGIVEASGVAFEARGGPGLPSPSSYHARRRVSWHAHQPLVGALAQMAKHRVPTWQAAAPRDHNVGGSGEDGFWPLVDTINAAAGTTADYVDLVSAGVIDNEIPDSNGYRVLVGMLSTLVENISPPGRRSLFMRVRVDTLGGGNIKTTSEQEFRWDLGNTDGGQWSPDHKWHERTFWGTAQFETWQYNGLLTGPSDDITRDARHVQWFELEVPESSITYPCELVVEARNGIVDDGTPRNYETHAFVVLCATASKPRDSDLGI